MSAAHHPRPSHILLSILAVAAAILLPQARAVADEPGRGSVRPRIEQLLAAMAAATLAGDGERYLELISGADPVFATEQQNWAADLAAHVPQIVEFTLRSEPVVEGNRAAAEVRFVWEIPGSRRRSITYPARFVREDGEHDWRYAGEDWKTIEGEPDARVQVLFFSGFESVARSAAEVFPEIRRNITTAMGLDDDEGFAARTQQIKLYPAMSHLQHSIYLSYSDSLSGWNEPGESIKLLAVPNLGRRSLQPVIAHEFGHVASFQYGPHSAGMPWWVLEGIAELVAEPWARNGERTDRTVRNWARAGDLRDWEQLADFRGEAMDHPSHVYRQGHQMMRFITQRFGADARNRWMIAMANGADIDAASREVLGISFEELDTLWRESLHPQPRESSLCPLPMPQRIAA